MIPIVDVITKVMISYEDPESIAAKAAWVDQQQLGGLMFWELAMDDDAHTLTSAGATGLAANHAPCSPRRPAPSQ